MKKKMADPKSQNYLVNYHLPNNYNSILVVIKHLVFESDNVG